MNGQAERVGWISQFDLSLATRRQVVLHGNVMDRLPDGDGDFLDLADWLTGALAARGYRRIVHYDHCARPDIRAWDDVTDPTAQWQAFTRRVPGPPRDAAADPGYAHALLRAAVGDPTAPTAVVVRGAELTVTYPSPLAASLHAIGAGAVMAGTPDGPGGCRQNIVIHVYARENAIPPEFIATDPHTRLVLIPRPAFEVRQRFIERATVHHRVAFGVLEAVRLTEGLRLCEIEQVLRLADGLETPPGDAELPSLLSLYRLGRRLDAWERVDPDAAEGIFRRHVVGQAEPIEEVVDALYRARHRVDQLIDAGARRPAMVLFFVGATGVGKSLLARTLAEVLTGSRENLKTIDMSEYQQDHTIHRLIGAPPGYVGFDAGGEFTNWVKERPLSVVLFDEVEKGHERILDLFLQVLDGARLTDGKGETVDLSDTVLVFTSNIGTAEPFDGDRSDRAAVEAHFEQWVKEHFTEEIERPELFNRLRPGVVVFNYIGADVAREVVGRQLGHLAQAATARFAEMGQSTALLFDLAVDADALEVRDRVFERVGFEEFGLRDVGNEVQRMAGTAVARFLGRRARRPRYHFVWDADARRVEIRPLEGGR